MDLSDNFSNSAVPSVDLSGDAARHDLQNFNAKVDKLKMVSKGGELWTYKLVGGEGHLFIFRPVLGERMSRLSHILSVGLAILDSIFDKMGVLLNLGSGIHQRRIGGGVLGSELSNSCGGCEMM